MHIVKHLLCNSWAGQVHTPVWPCGVDNSPARRPPWACEASYYPGRSCAGASAHPSRHQRPWRGLANRQRQYVGTIGAFGDAPGEPAERPPQGPARPRSGLAGRWGSVPNRLTPQLEAISRSRTLGRRASPRSRRSGRGLSDFRRERGGEAAVVRAAKLLLPRGDWGGYPDPLGRRSGRPRPWRCGLPCSGAAVSQPVRRAPPVSWLGSPA